MTKLYIGLMFEELDAIDFVNGPGDRPTLGHRSSTGRFWFNGES